MSGGPRAENKKTTKGNASTIITASINVNKIDKSKLIKGEKGTYLDLVLIDTPNNSYGNDYMIKQNQSKEDREKGIKTEILGNAKISKGKSAVQDDDEIPF